MGYHPSIEQNLSSGTKSIEKISSPFLSAEILQRREKTKQTAQSDSEKKKQPGVHFKPNLFQEAGNQQALGLMKPAFLCISL